MPMPELTQLSCHRGSPMGRRETHCAEREAPLKIEIREVPLVEGYDEGGAYWGCGQPLWRIWGEEDGELMLEEFRRADNRAQLQEWLGGRYRNATILAKDWPVADAVQSYFAAAEWTDGGPDHLDEDGSLQGDELPSAAAREQATADLTSFIAAAKALPGDVLATWEATDLGHYFWLSRNGHGSGFFDHPTRHGNALQALAAKYPPRHAYRNEAGELELE